MSSANLLERGSLRAEATWLELDQAALRRNVQTIKRHLDPAVRILAVVKANAYGHGLELVAQCLKDEASYFGVSTLSEALAVRGLEVDVPILLFGVLFGEAVETAIASNVTLSVSSFEEARRISRAARRIKRTARIHIKVDTGMGRLGIPVRLAISVVEKIASLESLELEGIYTHFSQGGEERDPFTENQIRCFNRLVDALSRKGVEFQFRHAANSNGVAHYRAAHFDLVRPGLLLYGISPSASVKKKITAESVLSWRAKIILLKRLLAGESTGYNRAFVSSRETTIGILPVGYGSGYPVQLSNKSEVLFRGIRYRTVGRVSMDYLAVDFGDGFDGKVGDTVTLLGREGEEDISCERLAELADTIPYEITTRLNPSLSRILV